ncbi:hypothetical protein SP19_123 [Salmonella phage 19]|nr:hypothetical protein SP19_123 [Salmonella phage 19]
MLQVFKVAFRNLFTQSNSESMMPWELGISYLPGKVSS